MGNPSTVATSAGSDPAEELYRNRFSQWTHELIRPDTKASLARFALQTMIRDERELMNMVTMFSCDSATSATVFPHVSPLSRHSNLGNTSTRFIRMRGYLRRTWSRGNWDVGKGMGNRLITSVRIKANRLCWFSLIHLTLSCALSKGASVCLAYVSMFRLLCLSMEMHQ